MRKLYFVAVSSVSVGVLALAIDIAAKRGAGDQRAATGEELAVLANNVPDVISVTPRVASKRDGGGTALTIKVRIPAVEVGPDGPSALLGAYAASAAWQADVLAAAARDTYERSAGRRVTLVHVQLVQPDGVVIDIGGGLGRGRSGRTFDEVTPAFITEVGATCAQWGLSNVEVTEVPGIRGAVMIRARAEDISTLRRMVTPGPGSPLALLLGDGKNFQGVYLEVDDAKGTPMYIRAFGGGGGSVWADPALGIQVGFGVV